MEKERFKGFRELIQAPLEEPDPRSYSLIIKLLDENQNQQNPFGMLIQTFTGKNFPNREAVSHWRHILENKKWMEQKMKRPVGIQVASIDYLEQQNTSTPSPKSGPQPGLATAAKGEDEGIKNLCFPGSHLEKLKEEMLRAKRYKHALSAIMLDVDDFEQLSETFTNAVADRVLTIIVKIIKKTIRTVDILACYSRDRFMLILPNTNKREAMELADRLRQNINQRTKRIEGLAEGVTSTLSVGQCSKEETSVDFLKRLESLLMEGKHKGKNAVYSM